MELNQEEEMSKIAIYDTTLRDGAQMEGVSFSVEDKLKICRRLDELGVHYIEGGWPGSNPKDVQFFLQAQQLRLGNAKLVAFGSTRRPDTLAHDDANLTALLAAGTPVIAIVGKSWDLHVIKAVETTLEENLAMIRDSVAFLKSHGVEVFFDAEHFFDGFARNRDYALQTLLAAAEAGADALVLCDTNGGTISSTVFDVVKHVASVVDKPLAIHAHNDGELAVANTLAAVQAGASQVQGTVNGYGERCGNANLCSIIPSLKLKLGLDCISHEQLTLLAEVSRYVSELANLIPDPHMPYVGDSAFAHKGGIHVSAIRKADETYEHIDPDLVGNRQRVLISDLSGKSNVLYKADQYGLKLNNGTADVRLILDQVKNLEKQGFQFEGAEGSFELLMRRTQPGYELPFELLDFLVLVETRVGIDILAEATVKIRVGDEVMHTAAQGDGPVNALDVAMRKALLPFYPVLANSRLTDYKVRVLDESAGTCAPVRVLITSTDGERSWGTVGSSPNIIEASWLALADSLEYALLLSSKT
jgi:2-isopropylmalate synthase